eukprot:5547172-Pyramimonas_sp.AAC.3
MATGHSCGHRNNSNYFICYITLRNFNLVLFGMCCSVSFPAGGVPKYPLWVANVVKILGLVDEVEDDENDEVQALS